MTWVTRQPKAKLEIFSKEDKDFIFVESLDMLLPKGGGVSSPIGDVVSITTVNGINQATGTFRIELVWRQDINGEPIYYKYIRPMDIVIIYLDGTRTTMVGIIDIVTKERSIKNNKPKRSVVLTGRSLGAIWEFDLIKYFSQTAGIPDELLERNFALQEGLIKYEFVNENLITVLRVIYEKLPAIEITYKDKKLKDFIDVGSELLCRRDEVIFSKKFPDPYSGSLFDYFKRFIGKPFNEIWTDSKDGKLFLRTRPTPFSMGDDGVKTISGGEHSGLTSSWENITSWNGKVFSKEGSVSPHINTWGISKSDVIGENLSRTHQLSYSIYGVLPTERIYGNTPEYQAFPPLIVGDDYRAFGSRDYISRIGFIPMKPEGGIDKAADEIIKDYRNRLYLMNKDNHRYERGTLTIKSNPYISAGDKLTYEEKGYYITAVQNAWRFGMPMQSVITVDRGMKEKERIKRYNVGKTILSRMGE